jgi:dihydrofolate reductase
MRKLIMFNSVSLDGYFTGTDGDMGWAHKAPDDKEWNAFVSGNARGGGALLLGRVTYEMMASFWPTPMALKMMPAVAAGMNRMTKYVFSRRRKKLSWENSELLTGDLVATVRKLKRSRGPDLAILGSGSLVAQLASSGLIDEYQVVVCPIVLGAGRTLFEGVTPPLRLKQTGSRAFANGSVVLTYRSEK